MTKQKKAPEEDTIKETVVDSHVAELEVQLQNMTDRWARAVADYQNLEKRIVKERISYTEHAKERVVERFLPALDTLALAVKHVHDHGLRLAHDMFVKALTEEGIIRIETINEKFDPMRMECISTVPGDHDDIVSEEVRAGYRIGDKVIRPAQVVVSKKEIVSTKTV